jgi:hypothetical protein
MKVIAIQLHKFFFLYFTLLSSEEKFFYERHILECLALIQFYAGC